MNRFGLIAAAAVLAAPSVTLAQPVAMQCAMAGNPHTVPMTFDREGATVTVRDQSGGGTVGAVVDAEGFRAVVPAGSAKGLVFTFNESAARLAVGRFEYTPDEEAILRANYATPDGQTVLLARFSSRASAPITMNCSGSGN